MVGNDLWEALELEPRIVAERAQFFQAFAGLVAADRRPDPVRLAELAKVEPPQPGLQAFGEPPGLGDEQRLEDFGSGPPRPRWERLGMEADALRQAGISMLLLDTRRGLALLAEAGTLYPTLAFALLLQAVSNRTAEASVAAAAVLERLYERGEPSDELVEEAIPPMHQVYLALAASSSPPSNLPPELVEAFGGRAAASSPMPLGSGGRAATWWSLAADLLRAAGPDPEPLDPELLAERLERLAGPHGRQLEISRLDRYHWRNYAAAVDLVDLDVACAVCIANRRLARVDRAWRLDRFEAAPALAQVSLRVGLEMSEPEEEPPVGERARLRTS